MNLLCIADDVHKCNRCQSPMPLFCLFISPGNSFVVNRTKPDAGSEVKIFNLSQDPYEETDLGNEAAYERIRRDMLTTLRNHEKTAVDPIETEDYGPEGTGECDPGLNGDVFQEYMV